MSEHRATIQWHRTPVGTDDYSRDHVWLNESGASIDASASPLIVAPPLSGAGRWDPEQGFVASITACHMLWFLSLAEQRGYRVRSYRDGAAATLSKDATGRLSITRICLAPLVRFDGHPPDEGTHAALHEAAHARCFLAASVRSAIQLSPRIEE